MSKHRDAGHGFADDPQKVSEAGRKGNTKQDVKTDRAEKARVGGQHSHGGTPRRGEG
ncbi:MULTISPECIES: KGG domain-containing protein [Pseudomonas]|uniref:KGG domain-containing protein n=1 Tax=Pseudomonas TaxID=286 RepID=UPI0018AB1DCB|nr:KGG domain-containing protein [Pseudomonas guariconensis]MBF8739438.1 general stress protein [Pseudomonas guariconensis]MBF8750048.1 general stress protein [Pseudomonas guariconensis]